MGHQNMLDRKLGETCEQRAKPCRAALGLLSMIRADSELAGGRADHRVPEHQRALMR